MNKTSIANIALLSLGVSYRIYDFDNETTNQAKVIRELFQTSLDTVTEMSDWSFANKYQALALAGDGSAGYLYEYALPGDCMVLRQIGSEDHFTRANIPHQFLPSWEFNNSDKRILCNVEKAWGKYTRRIMQNEDMPNYFAHGVAAQLAMNAAPGIIMDKFAAIKNTLKSDLDVALGRAIAYDSGRAPDNRPQVSSYELLLQ